MSQALCQLDPDGQVCFASEFGANGSDTCDVADRNADCDDTDELQRAINHVIAHGKTLELDAGRYFTTETLFIGLHPGLFDLPELACHSEFSTERSCFSHVTAVIRGAKGASQVSPTDRNDGAVIEYIGPTDRPAVHIQGGRDVRLSHLGIVGQNREPETAYWDPRVDDRARWVCEGCSTKQHSPYAGLVVDGYKYRGAGPPADAYPTDTIDYIQSNTSGLELDNVHIRHFVAGLVLNPSSLGSNAAEIVLHRLILAGNTYGMAVGGSQARNVTADALILWGCYTGITGVTFGARVGQAPFIQSMGVGNVRRIFNFNNSPPGVIHVENMHAERFIELGVFGYYGSNGNFSGLEIESSHLHFDHHPYYRPPFLFESSVPTVFRNVSFETYHARPYSFRVERPGQPPGVSFENSTFGQTGFEDDEGLEELLRPVLNVRDQDPRVRAVNSSLRGNGPSQLINDEVWTTGLAGRTVLTPNVREIHIASSGAAAGVERYRVDAYPVYVWADVDASAGVQVVQEASFGEAPDPGDSSRSIVVRTQDAAVRFQTPTPELFAAGDWLYLPVQSDLTEFHRMPGEPSTFLADAPVGLVSDVDPESGAVTVRVTTDGLPAGGLPAMGRVAIVRPAFVLPQVVTAHVAAGSSTLRDVADVSGFRVGDWLQGAGLAEGARIVAVDAERGELVLNRAAVRTAFASEIYNTRLEPDVVGTETDDSSELTTPLTILGDDVVGWWSADFAELDELGEGAASMANLADGGAMALTQPAAWRRPQFSTLAGGAPALAWDSGAQGLVVQDGSELWPSGTEGVTFWVTGEVASWGASHRVLFQVGDGETEGGIQLRAVGGPGNEALRASAALDTGFHYALSTDLAAISGERIFKVQFDGERLTLWADGELLAEAEAYGLLGDADSVGFGLQSIGRGNGHVGTLQQAVVMRGTPTAQQDADMLAYLRAAAGL